MTMISDHYSDQAYPGNALFDATPGSSDGYRRRPKLDQQSGVRGAETARAVFLLSLAALIAGLAYAQYQPANAPTAPASTPAS